MPQLHLALCDLGCMGQWEARGGRAGEASLCVGVGARGGACVGVRVWGCACECWHLSTSARMHDRHAKLQQKRFGAFELRSNAALDSTSNARVRVRVRVMVRVRVRVGVK
jgi:hypothetical protein